MHKDISMKKISKDYSNITRQNEKETKRTPLSSSPPK